MTETPFEVKISGNVDVTPALREFVTKKVHHKLGRLSKVNHCHFTIQPNSSGNYSVKGLVKRDNEQFCHELVGREVYRIFNELINNLHEQVTAAFSAKEHLVKSF